MKIFIICSKHFYNYVNEIKSFLEEQGHEITLPNSFDNPMKEEEMKKVSKEEHIKWKSSMMKQQYSKVDKNDAVLVLNFEKKGIPNYIGGATFMEIVKAWEMNKKIFLYNPIPECIFTDELKAINPKVINGDFLKLNPRNIEVEVQTFISEKEYHNLLDFFRDNAEFVKEDFQETFYFDENSNLRIQRNSDGAKLWHKEGQVHDEFMEEIEIRTKEADFENLEKFLNKLGHSVKIKWLRNRNQFNWNGIKVCVDSTKGYGYILELEKMGNEDNKEIILSELKNKLKELRIRETPKEVFKEKYEYYKNNWRELI